MMKFIKVCRTGKRMTNIESKGRKKFQLSADFIGTDACRIIGSTFIEKIFLKI